MAPNSTDYLRSIDERLTAMEKKLSLLLNTQSQASNDAVLLSTFSTKQHAIIQMMLRDATIREISERLGVSDNTIKTHIQIITKKCGENRKTGAIVLLLPIFERIDPTVYQNASGGLPLDWDDTYSPSSEVNKLLK